MIFRILSKKDITDSVILLNQYLSFGLAKKESLERHIGNNSALVCEVDGKVVGFALALQIEKIEEELLNHHDMISKLPFDKELSIFKQIVVDKGYRNKGIADKLVKSIISRLQNRRIFALAWKKPVDYCIERILVNNGFKEIMIKEFFWYEDSLLNNYGCPYCGGACKCPAVLFLK
ncbi:GNAT family N-acetyltransferase [Risungbinella massiliensis]|uniref:GNAT family N-acetyltransferase n=1 Tax=Risungbinella massiliensis TaxID=1329796 RepID=UPI0005CC7896|nr:GNAT family N-acetyltransferase [Risungbinella massiliensis]